MTMKKTRLSTSRRLASAQRSAIDDLVDSLSGSTATDIPDNVLESLSDLGVAATDHLKRRWSDISLPVRLALVRAMVNRFESDIEHHYDRALVAALHDVEIDVKLGAFEGLTDTSEPLLLDYLLNTLPSEAMPSARAAGARIMGQFVLASELGRLEEGDCRRLHQTVLDMLESDPDPEVRLHMLESAGYFAGDKAVIDAITDAWSSSHHDEQVSALRAMGHQCDPRWLEVVLNQFRNDEPEIRFEAARAAGTVGNQLIVPQLVELTSDDDVEVQMAAIASLGQIGGESAIAALRSLEQSDSPAISDAAGAAVEEALLLQSVTRPPGSIR
jgi:HEAT repeat protein